MKIILFDKQMKQKWKSRKIPKFFPKSRDQKYWKIPSRKIPGFSKILSRKIPGLKFLILLGPADESIYWKSSLNLFRECKCTKNILLVASIVKLTNVQPESWNLKLSCNWNHFSHLPNCPPVSWRGLLGIILENIVD